MAEEAEYAHVANEEAPVYEEEAPAYEEEAPVYEEEAPVYEEDSATNGVESARPDTEEEGTREKHYTLLFARRPGQVLLGMKKRGFGAGKWNGFGGKIEAEETCEQAAVRWST
jgi:hypothetical protein